MLVGTDAYGAGAMPEKGLVGPAADGVSGVMLHEALRGEPAFGVGERRCSRERWPA
jgi:hypothetical protein